VKTHYQGRAAGGDRSAADAPASLLLVHGAGSGPWVYDEWAASFPGLGVFAVDLHEGLDVARASMAEYAARVVGAAKELSAPVALCGWSMGGLVVLLAAADVRPHSVVLIEPSPPAEIQGYRQTAELPVGTFDPELVYGPFPRGACARPESALARAERKRGVSVPELPCPSLVIYGDEFPDDRGRRIGRLYGSEQRQFRGLDHWDLVRADRVREAIERFLTSRRIGSTCPGVVCEDGEEAE
jgi:pimeloyl-ACP methyl ester carboxylesterase